ncbi:MAG: hypothetical protein LC121_04875 [Anaerolineae bacterium]|nr:hypothetical protein [Anaerolineae bacterium]
MLPLVQFVLEYAEQRRRAGKADRRLLIWARDCCATISMCAPTFSGVRCLLVDEFRTPTRSR